MSKQQKTWHDRHKDSLTKGQRAADIMRNGMGSWPFVGSFIGFMLIWAAINTWALATKSWDPYPFILLNLFLSMLAGLQGAILLIAAKRQDGIAAALAQHDFDTNSAARRTSSCCSRSTTGNSSCWPICDCCSRRPTVRLPPSDALPSWPSAADGLPTDGL